MTTGAIWRPPVSHVRLLLAATLAAALALGARAPAASARPPATLPVTTTADEYDLSGEGTGCALREAIVAANTDSAFGGCPAGSGADQIVVPAGTYTLTRAGPNEDLSATGDLDLRSPLTIAGASAAATTLHGGGLDRVLDISGTLPTEITGLTITGGLVGASFGAGILNRGTPLTLTHTAVISNISAISTGGVVNIGGVLVIAQSEIRGNGLYGSLHNSIGGSLRLTGSLVQGNHYGPILGGSVVIQSSQILSNTHGDAGLTLAGLVTETARVENSTIGFNPAGVLNSGSGRLVIAGSTVSDNEGAGLRNPSSAAQTVVLNSTISGNDGIGVDATNGTFALYNVTLSGNDSGGFDGGGLRVAGVAVTLQNTLIAGNTDPGGQAPDCAGTVNSLGYNLVENALGCTLAGITTGNVLNQAAGLGPLHANGGPTLTHALLAGSPAINAGDPGGCRDGDGAALDTDQRGYERADRCDIGAFEFGAQTAWLLFVPFTSR
ncbi:MAG: CSLREA domain-containing protein [Anaerolineales bacterium]|nr:CSLREA domain-containing protein [Anaerolineales bacterium]